MILSDDGDGYGGGGGGGDAAEELDQHNMRRNNPKRL